MIFCQRHDLLPVWETPTWDAKCRAAVTCSDTGTWYSSKVCTLRQRTCQVHWVKGVWQVFLYWDALSTQLKICLAVGWSHLLQETFRVCPGTGTHVAQLSWIGIYFIFFYFLLSFMAITPKSVSFWGLHNTLYVEMTNYETTTLNVKTMTSFMLRLINVGYKMRAAGLGVNILNRRVITFPTLSKVREQWQCIYH